MKIIIAGAYAIGSHLAKLLSRNNQDIVLIDDDEQRLENISSDYDILTMHACDARRESQYEQLCHGEGYRSQEDRGKGEQL